ncbi:MAG: circadian clock protein KaiC [Candidatus Methanoperedens nitroreducens]|uniref:non-specific serine/threonine protein kinase n=1 Tax=Candidatus Methanoperedens nitratireducens TaxID=1392998 RepID=A0A0P8AIV3_9EURY|nr:circadian clock protein KaiC [Candidatus Methanoperedens sp. BLZ2]KAB2945155.1 MAG: circadian clock protein KaiC [Candidatus Methanoperedens sp.]KPQ44551.1 MAG: circadian clock protein KaiC [Candidatus Methanoperedens sp. BLZ1]MBZ0173654.1 circadian clock protein KaiC [Candidatus Methanoperedens nitroreducens]MCX9077365.1 circadian clock protein KaiC [Candidatus Methanoperedens sp.]
MTKEKSNVKSMEGLQKCQTGIRGLDEITDGGLPKGRPTLVCGSAGCGKTLLAMEFLVRGAVQYKEPGVFMSFEESSEELVQNVASLGFDLKDLEARKMMSLDHVRIERSEIEETGEYDLEGLFIRLNHSIDSIGAKRVVLDTIESLFGGLSNESILRAELRRLFSWLKEKGVTAIITGEKGEGTLTRHGLEEYVSDCVILLDNRVDVQISTRRLRVVKYRGSAHGTNEYPFLIDEKGISVLPITSLGLQHDVSSERISSGIPRLDTMLGEKGFYRGSSILISGTAGTGKTSTAASFANAACKRGERCLYFAFEEAPNQIIRNMRSIGIDLEPWMKQGLLQIYSVRPTIYGLEMHLVKMAKLIDEFKPKVVIVDPITNLISIGNETEVKAMLARLIDYLKAKQITALFTNLSQAGGPLEQTEFGISSLMDSWLLLRDIEVGGERNRGLYILKSRGMSHSNQIREFLLTDKGIDLIDVYLGPSGVLTGSARAAIEMQEKTAGLMHAEEIERKKRELERQRKSLEAQIAALHAEFEAKEEEVNMLIHHEKLQEETQREARKEMAHIRKADASKGVINQPKKAGKRNIK